MTYDKNTIEFAPLPTKHNFYDITGRIFSRLTVLGFAGVYGRRRYMWFCECECGTIKLVDKACLTTGNTKSCGCWASEEASKRAKTHGWSKGANRHPLYSTWVNIRNRCRLVTDRVFKHYGGRGIKLCQGWDDFVAFQADMGERPSPKHTVERRDNNQHYSCGHCDECITNGWEANCYWATMQEQANNTRRNRVLTYQGRTQTLAMWCRELHLSYGKVLERLRAGKTVEFAFESPNYVRQ